MENLPKDKKIILFDGVCNLCNQAVQYVIKHDEKDLYRFVALQSDLGIQILEHIKIDPNKIDSIVLYEPGVAYFYKSSAAIEIATGFGGLFSLGTVLKIIPAKFRDWIYDYVAKNRYEWYGKKDSCMIPTPELRSKFL